MGREAFENIMMTDKISGRGGRGNQGEMMRDSLRWWLINSIMFGNALAILNVPVQQHLLCVSSAEHEFRSFHDDS